MTSWIEACKDLLFPPSCLHCNRRLVSSRPPIFCSDCCRRLPFISSPLCLGCGEPFFSGADHLCGRCLSRQYSFDLARSLFSYQPPLSVLIPALKFRGDLTALASLGRLVSHPSSCALFTEPDILLPVPLHSRRLRERGFNQALLLARACFPEWKGKIEPGLLARTRSTPPQSALSGRERRRNLKNAFVLADPQRIAGKEILLVDDVFTTGSTVNECSRVLRAAGASRVQVFTLARSLSG